MLPTCRPLRSPLLPPSPRQLLARRRGLDLTQYGAVDEAAAKRLRLGGAADGAARAPLPDGVQEQLDDFENFTDECAPGQGGALVAAWEAFAFALADRPRPFSLGRTNHARIHTHNTHNTPITHTQQHTRFWREVAEHTRDGALDMDDLPEGASKLEACYILTKLTDRFGPLNYADNVREFSRGARRDVRVALPGLRLSMHVQRLIELERRDGAREAAKLRHRIARLEAQLAAAGIAVEGGGEGGGEAEGVAC